MKIIRDNNSIIKKRKINLDKLPIYDDKKIQIAIKMLNQTIEESFISHFNYISYALKEENNCKITTFLKTSGCISDCKRLKTKLKKLGIETYYVSCQANGFSNPAGDLLVKEAHVFLVSPSLKNNQIYFTIFDPGFRMNNVIQFYDTQNSSEVIYEKEGIVKAIYIDNQNYPYKLTVNKRINYKRQISPASIEWNFNPYYQTLNINEFNEQLYQAMFSLKLMNYPQNLDKYICIRSKILEKSIEIYTPKKNQIMFYSELSLLTKKQLKNIFKKDFLDANLTQQQLTEFINNLYILIHNSDTYIKKIINSKVIEDYLSGNILNR